MQAAAFWRGDIIKQETMDDFLHGNQAGTLRSKLRPSDKTNFNVHDNTLNNNTDWQNAFDENMSVSKDNYNTNYFRTKKVLENFRATFDGDDLTALNAIIAIFNGVAPSRGRTKRRTVTINSKRTYMNASDEIEFIKLHLRAFKTEVQQTSKRASGNYTYGKNTEKHLKHLMEFITTLEKIYNNNFTIDRPVQSGNNDTPELRRGNLHSGLNQNDLKIAKEIQDILKEEITIYDEEITQVQVDVWEALHKVGEQYEILTIPDIKHKKEIRDKVKGLGKLTSEDRITFEWLDDMNWESTMDLFHYYDEYEFAVKEVMDINNTLLRYEVGIKTIESEANRLKTQGKTLTPAKDNRLKELHNKKSKLTSQLPELTRETRSLEQEITGAYATITVTDEQGETSTEDTHILEKFKTRIAGEYDRSAREVADALSLEPSLIDIVEE